MSGAVWGAKVVNRFALTAFLVFGTAVWGQEAKTEPAKPAQAPGALGQPGLGETAVAAPVDPKSYVIGAQDVLGIRVWREPELSGSVAVRPDGKITLPLVGDIDAAGFTPEALTVRVAESLGKILNKPEVTISVVSVQSKRYFLSGKVGRGGGVPLVVPTTVLQALSSAGLGEWAKKSKIIIMRGTQRIKFNYDEVIKGKKLEQNIFLQDGDHIFVP
ncbi:MAG: polysaccharide biosynthesis/export family protein [Bryobacteraceae bacterium]|nr:polysaccharide biosynthesis/export family protein [Bryobacteraceae bacterium]